MADEERSPTSGSDPAHDGDYAALTRTVRDLVDIMRDGGIGKLDVRRGDLRISLETQASQSVLVPSALTAPAPSTAGVSATGTEVADAGYVIPAPMIGTYYAAPAPGEAPFVQVGDLVAAGQTVAIIEAMKIMNEIVAEQAGLVEEIFVANGEAVEYGQPLMRLRPQAPSAAPMAG